MCWLRYDIDSMNGGSPVVEVLEWPCVVGYVCCAAATMALDDCVVAEAIQEIRKKLILSVRLYCLFLLPLTCQSCPAVLLVLPVLREVLTVYLYLYMWLSPDLGGNKFLVRGSAAADLSPLQPDTTWVDNCYLQVAAGVVVDMHFVRRRLQFHQGISDVGEGRGAAAAHTNSAVAC